MPTSGYTFEWMRTQYRALHPDGGNDASGWTHWGASGGSISSHGEAAPGDRPDPTWWITWGECQSDDDVSVWRADNADVAVTRFEGLWISEWVSGPQAFFWKINTVVRKHPCRRPAYLPPARYPFVGNSPYPRA